MKWYRPLQTGHTPCSRFHEAAQATTNRPHAVFTVPWSRTGHTPCSPSHEAAKATANRPHAVFTARRFHEMVQATADRPHVVFTVPWSGTSRSRQATRRVHREEVTWNGTGHSRQATRRVHRSMKWYRPQQTGHTSCSPFHEVVQAAADRPHVVFTVPWSGTGHSRQGHTPQPQATQQQSVKTFVDRPRVRDQSHAAWWRCLAAAVTGHACGQNRTRSQSCVEVGSQSVTAQTRVSAGLHNCGSRVALRYGNGKTSWLVFRPINQWHYTSPCVLIISRSVRLPQRWDRAGKGSVKLCERGAVSHSGTDAMTRGRCRTCQKHDVTKYDTLSGVGLA